MLIKPPTPSFPQFPLTSLSSPLSSLILPYPTSRNPTTRLYPDPHPLHRPPSSILSHSASHRAPNPPPHPPSSPPPLYLPNPPQYSPSPPIAPILFILLAYLPMPPTIYPLPSPSTSSLSHHKTVQTLINNKHSHPHASSPSHLTENRRYLHSPLPTIRSLPYRNTLTTNQPKPT